MTRKSHKPAEPLPEVFGPTPEATRHADYEQRLVVDRDGRAGKAQVRVSACLLEVLRDKSKSITRQQCEAGHRFGIDHETVWGRTGNRDPLDLSVRGGESYENQTQVEILISAKRRLQRILNLAGPGAYAILRQVAIYNQPLGEARYKRNRARYAALRSGLDVAADAYGIPVYENI